MSVWLRQLCRRYRVNVASKGKTSRTNQACNSDSRAFIACLRASELPRSSSDVSAIPRQLAAF